MKTLVIGMDGAKTETFKRGWTPFISSLIEQGAVLELKEDLISRGWAEIITGKHGIETGALYDRPKAEGNLDWSQRFRIGDIPGLGSEVKPIWQVLNERGYKVGIMNVPTTYPAPAVDGFFVSGGGGGAKVIQDPTEALCYPKEILDYLIKAGYIVDERFWSLIFEKRIKDEKTLFLRLDEKNLKRTKTFVKLSSDYNVDFGFVVYKSSSVMCELFTIPELIRDPYWEEKCKNNMLSAAKEYYKSFDEQIKYLVETFEDAEIILVSDHGMSETEYLVNMNKLLQENGFQHASSAVHSEKGIRYVKNLIKPLIPANMRHLIKQKTQVESIYTNPIKFERDQTLAFCVPKGDWCNGIYINDKERFNGPVATSEIRNISEKISTFINDNDIAQKHGLSSYLKPENESSASVYYPDVIIDYNDGYLFSNSPNDFIVRFNQPNDPIDLKRWIDDFKRYSGKAHHPIALSTKGWLSEVTDKAQDLRLVYDHILSTFQNRSKRQKPNKGN